jgi:hypothetical protein
LFLKIIVFGDKNLILKLNMNLSAIRKFVLFPIIASAGIFAAMSLPLVLFGDKPVSIRFEEEPIFDGKLRDVAPPYVVLITTLSLGVGVSAAAISGWKSSARKSVEVEKHLSHLEQHLDEKDQMLREMKLADSRLQVAGLSVFLDEELPFEQAILCETAKPNAQNNLLVKENMSWKNGVSSGFVNVSQPVVAQAKISIPQPLPSSTSQNVSQNLGQKAVSASAYPQRHGGKSTQTATIGVTEEKTALKSAEVAELQRQLQLMMEQMQQMQNNLQSSNQEASYPQNLDKFSVYYEAPQYQEVSFK